MPGLPMERLMSGPARPSIRSAPPPKVSSHEIVRAGAGAGKTYTLTHKVMEIAEKKLQETGKLPRIVVTTFTRKATQELRERLMLLALEEKPHLVDFVNSKSNLVVSTIHGVMDLYLKRFGSNVCIDPAYRIVGPAEATKLARQVLRRILFSDSARADMMETLPFGQMESLARRISVLLAENPQAKPFSLDDFKKLFEAKSLALARALEDDAKFIKTAEGEQPAWGEVAETLRRLAAMLKQGPWEKQRGAYQALSENLRVLPRRSKNVSEEISERAKDARDQAVALVEEAAFDPEAWKVFSQQYAAFEPIARAFAEEFQKAKREAGVLEISDLELEAMNCIRQHPQTAEAFWQEWDHWLIDEFQDTSPFQVALLGALTGQRPQFLVGDPQQSIYLFRGARTEVFAAREKDVVKAGGKLSLLKTNRRSAPELLHFINDFFARLEPPFQAMDPHFSEQRPKLDPSKVVATVFLGSENGETEESSEELNAVVTHVQKLLAEGALPSDICVLGRTNAVLSEVAAALGRYQLPTHVHAAAGFYDRREIRDALSLLKFLVNPHDAFNTIELLRSPWFKVSDGMIAEHMRDRPKSLWEKLVGAHSMSDQMKSVGRLQALLQETREHGLSETFRRALIDIGMFDLCRMHDVSGRRESNLWKLIGRLRDEECRAGFNPIGFITESEIELKLDESNSEGDAVAAVEPDRINLMTVHSSKGLEFKHVIIPRMHKPARVTTNEPFTFDEKRGLWAFRVPYGEDRQMTSSLPEKMWLEEFKRQELAEHARVLYVALTRASETTFLSWVEPAKPTSWASMVRINLQNGLRQTDKYAYKVESGFADPVEVFTSAEEVVEPRKKWRPDPPKAVGPLGLDPEGRGEKEFSVTEIMDRKVGRRLVSGGQADIVSLLMASSRGTAVHKLLELLKYRSRDMIEPLIRRWFPEQEDRVLAAIEYVKKLREPPLMEIVTRGEVEWGFAAQIEGVLIPGQIDLWGRSRRGDVWIVDYKTGNPEFKDKAFDQMALYASALRKSGLVAKDDWIRLAAVFPFSEQVFVQNEPEPGYVRKMLGLDGAPL